MLPRRIRPITFIVGAFLMSIGVFQAAAQQGRVECPLGATAADVIGLMEADYMDTYGGARPADASTCTIYLKVHEDMDVILAVDGEKKVKYDFKIDRANQLALILRNEDGGLWETLYGGGEDLVPQQLNACAQVFREICASLGL